MPPGSDADTGRTADPTDRLGNRPAGRGRRGLRRVRVAVAGGLLLVFVLGSIGVWLLSADARREIDALAVANADSTQWSLAQAEVELLTLKNVLLAASVSDDPDLREVRQRFDIFYSRMLTLKRAPSLFEVRRIPEVDAAIRTVDGFLDRTVGVIDGPDADLRARLPDLAAEAQAMRTELRRISLAGVRVFAAQSESQRERVASALFSLGLLTVLLFLVLLGFIAALFLSLEIGRRRAEQIALARSRLRAVVSTAQDAVVVADREGRILDFNGGAERIFGYSPAEAIGQPMGDLIVPDHLRAAHAAGMKRHAETGERRVIGKGLVQLEARDRAGRVFPVELSISTAESEEGEVFVSFIRDISARVAARNELVEARDKALAGERAKAELLAVMSHEMRTPLNGIIGGLDLLGRTDLTDRQKHLVAAMDTSGQMLLDHVNTVLDISRMDAGGAAAAQEPFDPEALVAAVVESLRVQARARGNSLAAMPAGAAIGTSVGDAARLRQVLVNLVGNAIKFTSGGSISVEYERLGEGDLAEFRVIDTGIGIADADSERIFEDFVTLDTSYTRAAEGTGLGLGIVRRLVTVMGGEIGVESEPGEGSLFWVRLPLPPAAVGAAAGGDAASRPAGSVPAAPRPDGTAAGPAGTGPDVLLVEDNEINRMVAREFLAAAGCVTTEAPDGERGVAAATGRRFDLILMDISMPGLDGVAATRQIRAGGGPNAATPIVALTAHALPADIDRFRDAGMTDVLVKPLTRDRLFAALHALRRADPDPAPMHGAAAAHAELIEALGRDKAAEVVARVAGELEAGLRDLTRAVESGRPLDEIGHVAHKLAGLAALIGLSGARSRLIAIETAARAGDGDRARAEVQALAAEPQAFRPAAP